MVKQMKTVQKERKAQDAKRFKAEARKSKADAEAQQVNLLSIATKPHVVDALKAQTAVLARRSQEVSITIDFVVMHSCGKNHISIVVNGIPNAEMLNPSFCSPCSDSR